MKRPSAMGSTHICTGLWACSIMKKSLLRSRFQFGEVRLNGRVRLGESHLAYVLVARERAGESPARQAYKGEKVQQTHGRKYTGRCGNRQPFLYIS